MEDFLPDFHVIPSGEGSKYNEGSDNRFLVSQFFRSGSLKS